MGTYHLHLSLLFHLDISEGRVCDIHLKKVNNDNKLKHVKITYLLLLLKTFSNNAISAHEHVHFASWCSEKYYDKDIVA